MSSWGTRVHLKPVVYKADDGSWVASLDHVSWQETSHFFTFEAALDHALWLGYTNHVWDK